MGKPVQPYDFFPTPDIMDMDACETLSLKMSVSLYYVSPYWSSVLGEEKDSKPLEISRHQAAAYFIALRGLSFYEFYKQAKK